MRLVFLLDHELGETHPGVFVLAGKIVCYNPD